ncbi:DUF6404 family protein [Bdellovibrio sp. SKB1291214]|uniref:DUF6404 family protein n=1 Tax=Bdellovibrio sp. SKB1291214 TaxID=1732569 RepID=UPI000B51C711|nr:DUF6404 family protein [Bdellovibrio sp. SKB1291214]UYL07971.1 DUF6404 family protein [Bdellovibrio sp. SKB1291214]
MTYAEKVVAWNSYAKTKEVPHAYAQFPSFLGIKLEREPAPLILSSSSRIVFYLGANFALPWGLVMYFLSWRNSSVPVYGIVCGIFFAGVSYGAIMAYLIFRQRKRIDVTSWESFHPVDVIA